MLSPRQLILVVLHINFCSSLQFKNHKYNDVSHKQRVPFSERLRKEVLKRRHEDLLEFVNDANNYSEEYSTPATINLNDIVGVIPKGILKVSKIPSKSQKPPKPNPLKDNEPSELNEVPVHIQPFDHVNFDESNEQFGLESYDWADEKPAERVKIHVYRGPNMRHTVLKDDVQHKYYAPWGFYVSEPVGRSQFEWDVSDIPSFDSF